MVHSERMVDMVMDDDMEADELVDELVDQVICKCGRGGQQLSQVWCGDVCNKCQGLLSMGSKIWCRGKI